MYLMAGIIFKMKTFKRVGWILLLVSLIFLAATYIEQRVTVELPFRSAEGYSGSVSLALPVKVVAGDQAEIRTLVSLDANQTPVSPLTLAGRVEAGFEEISPAGLVSVNLGNTTPIVMKWTLRTARAEVYPGKLWLWLSTDAEKRLILARDFEISSHLLLGFRAEQVRVAFIILILLSIMMLGFERLRRK